ncbi:MAG: hypothetical protein ACLQGP_41210 [Isosphaeraceae bacterium]
MQGQSKSVRNRESARSPRRRAKATPLTTSGDRGVRDGFRHDVVTQDELGEYRGLKDQVERLKEEIEEQRLGIIERFDDGAAIQPGFFDAEVRRYQQRTLTAEKLEEILPRDEVERLKRPVTPTPRTELWVTRIP